MKKNRLDIATNKQRLALESWYTNSEQEPLNRCQQLLVPYERLIHDLKQSRQTSTDNRRIENNSKITTDQTLTATFTF